MKMHKNTKIAACIASFIVSLFLLMIPVITAAGAVAVPVSAIHSLFTSIGDFLFGGDDANDVVTLINKYLESKDTKKEIRSLYQPLIDKEKDIDIPLHWLVIPNLLAGIEDVDKDLIRQEIKAVKASNQSLETYINKLRQEQPYKDRFGSVSTTTITGYINLYTNYLGQEDDIDIGDLKEQEFLYPLKKKAIVTSEFGQRWPVTLPDGRAVRAPHTGTDLAYNGGNGATCGVPVYAAMSGEVVDNERTKGQAGANWGSIRFKNLDVWYLHLRDPFPYEVGTQIKKGQFVGYIGSTGLSSGCHLHFETHVDGKAVNARKFLDF